MQNKKEFYLRSLALPRKVQCPNKPNYFVRRFVSLVLSLRDDEERRRHISYIQMDN